MNEKMPWWTKIFMILGILAFFGIIIAEIWRNSGN